MGSRSRYKEDPESLESRLNEWNKRLLGYEGRGELSGAYREQIKRNVREIHLAARSAAKKPQVQVVEKPEKPGWLDKLMSKVSKFGKDAKDRLGSIKLRPFLRKV